MSPLLLLGGVRCCVLPLVESITCPQVRARTALPHITPCQYPGASINLLVATTRTFLHARSGFHNHFVHFDHVLPSYIVSRDVRFPPDVSLLLIRHISSIPHSLGCPVKDVFPPCMELYIPEVSRCYPHNIVPVAGFLEAIRVSVLYGGAMTNICVVSVQFRLPTPDAVMQDGRFFFFHPS